MQNSTKQTRQELEVELKHNQIQEEVMKQVSRHNQIGRMVIKLTGIKSEMDLDHIEHEINHLLECERNEEVN